MRKCVDRFFLRRFSRHSASTAANRIKTKAKLITFDDKLINTYIHNNDINKRTGAFLCTARECFNCARVLASNGAYERRKNTRMLVILTHSRISTRIRRLVGKLYRSYNNNNSVVRVKKVAVSNCTFRCRFSRR